MHRNIKSFYLLLFAVCFCTAQNTVVDFKTVTATVWPDMEQQSIGGEVTYTFTIQQASDSVVLDAQAMTVIDLAPDDTIELKTTNDKLILYSSFKEGQSYTVHFRYEATPKQALYFFGNQLWTQGQGKDTSHWLPTVDDPTDKMIFQFTIAAPEHLTALANGALQSTEERNGLRYWQYCMEHPMSSYLAAIVVGPFDKIDTTSTSGVPIELYFLPEHADKVEATYRYSQELFDFLETTIGVAYPWQNYKQVPVRDFLYAGMENTTLTIFSDAFVVDSIGFVDNNYVNVNAHELAHQWFGDLVTAASPEHHWLHEGFATYYALLAERDLFGDDYYYWQLYQSAEQLTELSDNGEGEAVMSTGASSLTYYQKGAWALHILSEKVGELHFRQAVKNYLTTYAYTTAATDDFLNEVARVSGQDLTAFKENWLQQTAFKSYEALQSLKQSDFILRYLELKALQTKPLSEKREQLSLALQRPVNDFIGQETVYQLHDEPIDESLPLYKKAFASENVLVRQAIALSLSEIPNALLNEYESLLNDASYLTQEAALLNLWMQFPDKRMSYLALTEGVQGFTHKNIRILWLALAIATEGYTDAQKHTYYNELSQYTTTDYGFETRETAFRYLSQLQLFTTQNLIDLVNACTHPNWRFAKAMRQLLQTVLQVPDYRNKLTVLKAQLPPKEQQFLAKQLE